MLKHLRTQLTRWFVALVMLLYVGDSILALRSAASAESKSTPEAALNARSESTAQSLSSTANSHYTSLQDFVDANKESPMSRDELGNVLSKISKGTFPNQANWNIFSKLRNGHPRLIFLKDDEDKIKSEVESDPEAKKTL